MEAVKDAFVKPVSGSGSGSGFGFGYGSGTGYGDGSGYGYGSGSGYGSRSGFGYGDGDGDGDGSGSSSGYGDGSGSSSGYGDGSGFGYGSGFGSGSGYGFGFGDGVQAYNGEKVYKIDGVQTILNRVHGNMASAYILRDDLQLVPCYVVKGGSKFAHGKTIEEAMADLEEKVFEDMPVEEKISEFCKHFEHRKEYKAREFYDWHHRLTGSCELGRKNFAEEHEIDLESMMTPETFMELTKNAYGGSVIRQLIEKWAKKGEAEHVADND